ncbi:MAG TPA: carboxypeptidase regulatory-like domain-containing protein, partial [Longimicrobiales bacterium]
MNTLEVTVRGGPGRALWLSVVREPDPTFVVFGPERYVRRAGAPERAVERFTLPATAAPPFALHVENGAEGAGRVSSAVLRLNGRVVAGPSDFNAQGSGFTRDVELLADNTLEVELGGAPGGALALWLTATDTAAPRLEITAPAEGQVTNRTELEVAGRVEDETAVRLEVNGVVAALTDGAFSHTVVLASEGENTITVVATDAAGHRTEVVRTVVRDTEPPVVSWTSPADGLITREEAVRLQGTATDRTEVGVRVNGLPLVVEAGGVFAGEVALVEGENVLALVATDAAGNQTSLVRQVVRDSEPPVLEVTVPEEGAVVEGESVAVAGTVQDRTALTLTVNGQVLEVAADGTFSGTVVLAAEQTTLTFTATDAAGNVSTVVRTIERELLDLPPDPADVAPPLDPTVATNIATATAFLYSGDDPIQTGVAPGTIEPVRAAVVRGRVVTREGEPLPGVTVTVHGHPEYGQTLSRRDGWYDLAVNGGGPLTLHFEREGYLPAQRPVDVPWQDYRIAEDVALVKLDTVVTAIDLAGATEVQVARGSVVEDEDGARQATLLFEPGTEAVMVLPDGTEQPLSTLHVRATEYTVGEGGRAAMPGPLPPTVAYTYAVEFTVDEAIAAGAKTVRLSRPAAFYLDNFLEIPVGTAVPLGYYDYDLAAWVPEKDGVVLEILGIDSTGLAQLDLDGDGAPDGPEALADFGITPGERERLAALYAPGKVLWRVRIPHFTPWDLNFPVTWYREWTVDWRFPLGFENENEAPEPDMPDFRAADQRVNDPTCHGGSVIECENQVLGEVIPVDGTEFTLNYRSDRVPGYGASKTLTIPISGDSVPASLEDIIVRVESAGQVFQDTFPADPNQEYTVVWNGKDAYGRPIAGRQPARVSIGYSYPYNYAIYHITCREGRGGGFSGIIRCTLSGISDGRGSEQRWAVRQMDVTAPGAIETWDARGQGFGGWTLNVHHAYDPVGRVLYRGDGRRLAGRDMNLVISTVAGTGRQCRWVWDESSDWRCGDGGHARDADLGGPTSSVVGADGTIYISDFYNRRIRKVTADGIISNFAGTGTFGYSGDGGPADRAQIKSVDFFAIAPDGSMYLADHGAARIRKIDRNGIITTIAGTGEACVDPATPADCGVGGPALDARMKPVGIAVDASGTIYYSEVSTHMIWKIGADGILRHVAGTGEPGDGGDGGMAIFAQLNRPLGIALGPDGSLYVADSGNRKVRRITQDGIITTVAGDGLSCGDRAPECGDGGPATEASLGRVSSIAVAPDGGLYIADPDHARVRYVGTDGIITTFAGSYDPWWRLCRSFRGCGDGQPPTMAPLEIPTGVTIGPDGTVYITDVWAYQVRRVRTSPLPGFGADEIVIASDDGTEVFVFDGQGRHLRTLDAATGALRYRFTYSGGYLVAITDGAGRTTTIERDGLGTPLSIVSADGRWTELRTDADGYLAEVTNAADETIRLSYGRDGLLMAMSDPRDHTYTFDYDASGRLRLDADPAGGTKELTRRVGEDGVPVVTLTTGLGRATTYRVEDLPGGNRVREVRGPDGLVTRTVIDAGGTREMTMPDGTTVRAVISADPRFGLQAPFARELTVRTPGGLASTTTTARHVLLSNPSDPLSLVRQADTVRVNGRRYVSLYEAADRRLTTTTPHGRTTTTQLDSLGRAVRDSVAGLLAVEKVFGPRGFLTEIRQGDRTTTFGYNALGQLAAVTDPLGRTDSLFYDAAGRLVRQKLADGREVVYGYDVAGNLTSLTPPGRSAHIFEYDALNRVEAYDPPDVEAAPDLTRFRYDLDRHLTHVIRPGGDSIVIAYGSAGRPSAVSFDRGLLTFGYSPTTGNLESITAPGGNTLRYTYDGSLPLSEAWSGEVPGRVDVAYNNDFRVVSQTVNGTSAVTFTYDNDGLLTRAGALTIQRRPDNGLISGTALGSLSTVLGYNGFGELGHLSARFGASELYRAEYTRDDLGRITGLTETVQGVRATLTFAYDSAGRLKEVTRDGVVVEAYRHDANGNRLRATYPTGTLVGTYDAQDRLLSYGGASYTYAPGGELETKVEGSDTTRYTYDQLG